MFGNTDAALLLKLSVKLPPLISVQRKVVKPFTLAKTSKIGYFPRREQWTAATTSAVKAKRVYLPTIVKLVLLVHPCA